MFKKGVLLFITLALLVAVPLARAQQGLLYDTFEDGNADGWEPRDADNWEVVIDEGDYAYHQKNTNLGSHPGEQLNEWSIYTREEYDNIVLTMEIKSDEDLETNPQADYAVIFHFQDADNYYFAFFNSAQNTTSLVLRRKGVETTLYTYHPATIENERYNTVCIKTLNGHITVMANEHVIMEVTNDTFLSGHIGVGVRNDAAFFDDIFVAENIEPPCDYWEDFNDDILDGWTARNIDYWSTKYHDGDYELWLHTNNGNTHEDNLGEWVTIDDLYLSDFTFECDLQSAEWSDPTADLAVLFCYQDRDNYYYVLFNRSAGSTSLWRWQNGRGHRIDSYDGSTLPDQQWHHVKISRQNGDVKVYYDGTQILHGYDNNLSSGRIGLGSKNDTGWFDDVCIDYQYPCDITVQQPNGGEAWLEGSWQDIRWTSQNTSGTVALYYSLNGGSNWATISSGTSDDGYYQWHVPMVSSDHTNCLIRIEDANDAGCYDTSDRAFTILDNPPCSITVLEPNGGEEWLENTGYDIRWQSEHTSGTVQIHFSSDGGNSWSTITSSTADDGVYWWRTLQVNADLTRCRIRVRDANDFGCQDMSDGNFTIKNVSPLLLYIPNGHEAWLPGTKHDISWKPENPAGTVKLEYSTDGGASWYVIANNTPDDGCYSWTIPMVNTSMARVRVTSLLTPSNSDMSDANFTIGGCPAPSLWAADLHGLVGTSKSVDIEIHGNAAPISAFGFKILYDVRHLQFVRIEKGDLTLPWVQVNGSENEPGVVTVGGFHTEAIPTGSNGVLVRAEFMIVCETCTECDQSQIALTELIDDLIGMNACYGVFTYGMACALGDVNMDETISPADALCAFQMYLNGGVAEPGTPCDTECAREAADANCDGMITPQDALLIFQAYINGQGSMECPSSLAKAPEHDIEIELAEVAAAPGEEITVPLRIDPCESVRAFGLELEYPADLLEYVGFERSEFTRNWVALEARQSEANRLVVGGFDPEPAQRRGAAELVVLKFRAREQARGSGEFVIHDVRDDLAMARTSGGEIRVGTADALPKEYALRQNYPNPFNLETEIVYQLPEAGQVEIAIVDVTGRRVRGLVSGQMEAGTHRVTWNGLDDDGRELATGIYMAVMKAGGKHRTIKMLLLK